MKKQAWISPVYMAASGAVLVLFGVVAAASHLGWGLSSDAQALAQARRSSGSVRSGSLHMRHHYGGGPGFGK